MRNTVIIGTFAFGAMALFYGEVQVDVVALIGNEHITNIISGFIKTGTVTMGTLAAYLHINPPEWMQKPPTGP